MKTQKISKSQEVAIHTTPSTDPKETRERENRARRMAEGRPRWSTSGRRVDKDGQKEE